MTPFEKMRQDFGLEDPARSTRNASAYRLQRYLTDKRIPINTGLNILQRNGVISDNCVEVYDVAPSDQIKAVDWLEGNVWRDKHNRIKVKTEV